MKKNFLYILILFLCGCATTPMEHIKIGDDVVTVVPVDIPYKYDYVYSILCEKNPWNQELAISDIGFVLPFGQACALREYGPFAHVKIRFEDRWLILYWLNKEYSAYEMCPGCPPRAIRIRMENADNPLEWNDNCLVWNMIINEIPIKEAINENLENIQTEQIVIFCDKGLLVKRNEPEGRWSLVRFRGDNLGDDGVYERKVLKTKDDERFLEWVSKHPDEVDIFFYSLERKWNSEK